MNVPPGSTVAIQGLGGLGHLAIQYANRFGYRVVALSRDSKKEKFVRELGAHEYIDSSKEDAAQALQKLGGASLIVATAPNAQVIAPLVDGLGILGKLLILSGKGVLCQSSRPRELTRGVVPGEVSINTGPMVGGPTRYWFLQSTRDG